MTFCTYPEGPPPALGPVGSETLDVGPERLGVALEEGEPGTELADLAAGVLDLSAEWHGLIGGWRSGRCGVGSVGDFLVGDGRGYDASARAATECGGGHLATVSMSRSGPGSEFSTESTALSFTRCL